MGIEPLLYKIVNKILVCLDDLAKSGINNDYIDGEKTAYIECVEIIQELFKDKKSLLDFDVEKLFEFNTKN